VATLVTKLQVFIQVYKNKNAIYYYIYISYSKKEINNSIDDTSQQTVQNFPRILREIEVLKQEAFMLKEQMKNVREDLIKVEKNTVNESMKLLLDLDIMRTNILNIQMGLQVNNLYLFKIYYYSLLFIVINIKEADNWTTLTSDLESILQSKDINKIADHIQSMQNSLTLLQDENNEYLIRCSLLEDFKNKFETLIMSDIIDSFNLKSIHNVNNYVQIFARINRLDQLKKYYYQCEKAKILEKNSFLIAELNSSFEVMSTNPIAKVKLDSNEQQNELLIKLLTNWLDYSIEIWQKEVILLT